MAEKENQKKQGLISKLREMAFDRDLEDIPPKRRKTFWWGETSPEALSTEGWLRTIGPEKMAKEMLTENFGEDTGGFEDFTGETRWRDKVAHAYLTPGESKKYPRFEVRNEEDTAHRDLSLEEKQGLIDLKRKHPNFDKDMAQHRKLWEDYMGEKRNPARREQLSKARKRDTVRLVDKYGLMAYQVFSGLPESDWYTPSHIEKLRAKNK